MIKGIILIAFMVVIMVLMVTRKVPTLIAIPILALVLLSLPAFL